VAGDRDLTGLRRAERYLVSVVHIRSVPTSDSTTASFEVEGLGEGPACATYSADVELDQRGHAWLPAALPILMKACTSASFATPLDPIGLQGSARVQELLTDWYPHLHRVAIEAESGDTASPGEGVGCFFSGGVDSFYSALERHSQITHLIFVHGFDIAIDDDRLGTKALTAARAAASELGKPLISIRTDIRRVSDRWSGWGEEYHGAALASIGLLLADHVGRVIIPATYQSPDLSPWGSHPQLDPLWSTSRVTFEHHGVELSRTEKIAAIASNPIALSYLRVCWQSEDAEYNCGRCSKCLRTMASLRAYGALDACATLPSRADWQQLRRSRKPKHYEVVDALAILDVLAARQISEPHLIRELRGMVRRDRLWRFARAVREHARAAVRVQLV
jgi:hypothetical protein